MESKIQPSLEKIISKKQQNLEKFDLKYCQAVKIKMITICPSPLCPFTTGKKMLFHKNLFHNVMFK